MAPAAQEQWYILYAIPEVADEMSKFPKFPNASFTFNEVPLPSDLTVAGNVVSATGSVEYPYIAAADSSGLLLFCGYTPIGLTYYICDPRFCRTLGILPHVGGFNCRHCVGLIRNHSDKRLMVAELNPCLFEEDGCVTLFCTVDMYKWVEKLPDCTHIVDRKLWRGDGVLSHQGLLWWFDLSFCILACNPFEDVPVVYQIKFPDVLHALPFVSNLIDGDIHRCLKVSEGSLRYVQIHASAAGKPVVSMWTLLSSNDPSNAAWEPTHEVPLDEIWSHPNYRTPLIPGEVPTVALVNPMNAHEVYFLLGAQIFSVNLLHKSVAQCKEFKHLGMPNLSSRLVHAWQLPSLELTKCHPLPGPDMSDETGVYVLTRYDSVEDFHDQALAAMSRWRPKLTGLEEIEEDEDVSKMSEELEEDENDYESMEDSEDDGDDSLEDDLDDAGDLEAC